jgi:hypothetical protein
LEVKMSSSAFEKMEKYFIPRLKMPLHIIEVIMIIVAIILAGVRLTTITTRTRTDMMAIAMVRPSDISNTRRHFTKIIPGCQVACRYCVSALVRACGTMEEICKSESQPDPQRPRDCVLGCGGIHGHPVQH